MSDAADPGRAHRPRVVVEGGDEPAAPPRPTAAPPRAETAPDVSPAAAAGPRVILDDDPPASPFGSGAPRLDLRVDHPLATTPEDAATMARRGGLAGWSTLTLLATGAASLVLGFAALDAANFVAAQFARSAVLGWITLAVALGGFGLIAAAIAREARGVLALRAVDTARDAFARGDLPTARAQAIAWAEAVPEARPTLPALRDAPDLPTLRALLEAGPLRALDERSRAMGRVAAVQAVAATAIAPSPAWDALVYGWRGVRLVRQVAALHGLRPGLAGTLSLLRRAALDAAAVAAADAALDVATRAVASHPAVRWVVGEAGTGAVAARRMLTLARAAAEACRIVPPRAGG